MKIKCAVCKTVVDKRAGAKYCSQNCKLVGWALKKKVVAKATKKR